MESLALNDQPLLKGQKAGTVQTLPKPVQHLERYTVELTDADVPGSLPELRNAVCAATQRNFHLLELRACNLNDDDLSLLWPVIDTSAPIEVQLKTPRRQLNSLDLRSNPLMSYGNRLVMLSKALTPDGALQALYLPSHFDKVYAQLYEHDRLSFHESLAKSQLQILEPLSSSQDPEFDLVKGALAARRTSLDVPVAAEPEVPPFDLSRVTDVDPLSFV